MPALDSLFEALKFDFSFPALDRRKVVRELGTLGFVGRAENVVLLGPPSVGKTHLAIGLAVKAAEAGHRVLFLTLEQLMGKLKRAPSGKPPGAPVATVDVSQGAGSRRDRLPAPVTGEPALNPVSSTGQALIQGCQPAVPSGGAALRESRDGPDEQQELRGLGRHLR